MVQIGFFNEQHFVFLEVPIACTKVLLYESSVVILDFLLQAPPRQLVPQPPPTPQQEHPAGARHLTPHLALNLVKQSTLMKKAGRLLLARSLPRVTSGSRPTKATKAAVRSATQDIASICVRHELAGLRVFSSLCYIFLL